MVLLDRVFQMLDVQTPLFLVPIDGNVELVVLELFVPGRFSVDRNADAVSASIVSSLLILSSLSGLRSRDVLVQADRACVLSPP
jgi:hypothetical protein